MVARVLSAAFAGGRKLRLGITALVFVAVLLAGVFLSVEWKPGTVKHEFGTPDGSIQGEMEGSLVIYDPEGNPVDTSPAGTQALITEKGTEAWSAAFSLKWALTLSQEINRSSLEVSISYVLNVKTADGSITYLKDEQLNTSLHRGAAAESGQDSLFVEFVGIMKTISERATMPENGTDLVFEFKAIITVHATDVYGIPRSVIKSIIARATMTWVEPTLVLSAELVQAQALLMSVYEEKPEYYEGYDAGYDVGYRYGAEDGAAAGIEGAGMAYYDPTGAYGDAVAAGDLPTGGSRAYLEGVSDGFYDGYRDGYAAALEAWTLRPGESAPAVPIMSVGAVSFTVFTQEVEVNVERLVMFAALAVLAAAAAYFALPRFGIR